jgi:hypothetical protein
VKNDDSRADSADCGHLRGGGRVFTDAIGFLDSEQAEKGQITGNNSEKGGFSNV